MKYRPASMFWHRVSSIWILVPLTLVGMGVHGIAGAIGGLLLAFTVGSSIRIFQPYVATEITWGDIELVISNYARYHSPGMSRLRFRCKGKDFFFQKEKIDHSVEGGEFVIWYRTNEWSALLNDEDDVLFTRICGREPVRNVQFERSKTFLVPLREAASDEVFDEYLSIMKHLVTKAGGTITDVTAYDNISYPLWINPIYAAVSPAPLYSKNFRGKMNGRPILRAVNESGRYQKWYCIIGEDGTTEPFHHKGYWLETHDF